MLLALAAWAAAWSRRTRKGPAGTLFGRQRTAETYLLALDWLCQVNGCGDPRAEDHSTDPIRLIHDGETIATLVREHGSPDIAGEYEQLVGRVRAAAAAGRVHPDLGPVGDLAARMAAEIESSTYAAVRENGARRAGGHATSHRVRRAVSFR